MTVKLSEGFKEVQIGDDQIFAIVEVKYDEKFGRAEVVMQDKRGALITQRFKFKGVKKKAAETALNIFSALAKSALDDWELEEVEPEDIQGLFVKADVYKSKSTKDDGKYFKNMRNFRSLSEDDETFEPDYEPEDEVDEIEDSEEDIEEDEDEDDLFD